MNTRAPLSDNAYIHTLLGAAPRPSTAERATAVNPPLPAPRATAIAAAKARARASAAAAELAVARAKAKAAAAAAELAIAEAKAAAAAADLAATELAAVEAGARAESEVGAEANAASVSQPGFAGGVDLYAVDIPSDNEEDREELPTMAHFAPIPNPPEQEYASLAAAEQALVSFSRRHGFEIAKSGSVRKGPTGAILRRPFRCAKGAHDASARYRAKRDAAGFPPQRAKPSKLTGCPFTVAIGAVEKDNPDGPYGIFLGLNPTHNHPAVNPIGLANHRRADRIKIRKFLRSARDAQIPPREVRGMASLAFDAGCGDAEEDEMVAPVIRDIYNEWARIRSETLQGATPAGRAMENE